MFGTEAQTELDDLKVVATKSGGRMKYIERIPWKAVRLATLNHTAPAQARARGPGKSAMFARLAIGPIRPPRLIAFNNRETAMKIAEIVLAGTAALTISSAALAQQALTGTITKINRINGTVEIQQTQGGTTGANSGGTTQEYKTQRGLSLDTLHAGDKVTFFATEIGGIKTITKLQEQ